MENFAVLGSLTWRIHQDFVQLYFVMLPAFFALALAIDWFRHPQGSPDFLAHPMTSQHQPRHAAVAFQQ